MNSLALLATALALADAPAERIVCVPATSGSGWECGKGEQAPAARSLPRRQEATTSAPPPYLLDPSSRPSVLVAPSAGAAPAASTPAPAAAPQPASVPVAERAATPAPAPVPAPVPEPAAAPTAAELPAAAPEAAVATPVLASEPPPATPAGDPPATAVATTPASAAAAPAPPPTPAIDATPAAQAVAPAAGQVPAAAPAAVARIVSSVARDAADLLALPGDGYTIQLAATRSVQGYAALRQQLGIAVEDTFVIRVRRGSEDWWLMLWRDFPDLASARSAAATLSAHGSFWPRRLAPLQGEVRATPN